MESTKVLGVRFDKNLPGEKHLLGVSYKLVKYVEIINKMSQVCNKKSLHKSTIALYSRF